MAIKRLEDIEREKRERFKGQIAKDISDVANKVFEKPKKKFSIFSFIIKGLLFLLAGVFVINFVLLNIWLLKFFIEELF